MWDSPNAINPPSPSHHVWQAAEGDTAATAGLVEVERGAASETRRMEMFVKLENHAKHG